MPTRIAIVLATATLVALALLTLPCTGRVALAGEEKQLTVFEDMEVAAFLTQVKDTTGYALIWNPQDKNIRGKKIAAGFTIRGDAARIYSAARAFLTFYELVIIPLGPKDAPTYAVMDARQTSSILKLKPVPVQLNDGNLESYEDKDGLFVTTTIKVEHMTDLRNARNALTRIVTGQNIGNVTEVTDARAFVVTDFAPSVVAVYRLIRRMDQPNAASSTTGGSTVAIALDHAEAQALAAGLSSHFAKAPAVRTSRPTSVPSSPSAPRITADSRTNQLLVTGSREEIAKIKEAVALLDVPVQKSNVGVTLVRLKNIDPGRAAATLSTMIHGSPTLWRGGRHDAAPTVIAHDETNALIVTATREHTASILALIQDMDKE